LDAFQWAKDNNLLLEAYSPLGSAEKVKKSLEVPLVDAFLYDVQSTQLTYRAIR
jgi:diketogulonate reductase-like aldo/keto reductase